MHVPCSSKESLKTFRNPHSASQGCILDRYHVRADGVCAVVLPAPHEFVHCLSRHIPASRGTFRVCSGLSVTRSRVTSVTLWGVVTGWSRCPNKTRATAMLQHPVQYQPLLAQASAVLSHTVQRPGVIGWPQSTLCGWSVLPNDLYLHDVP